MNLNSFFFHTWFQALESVCKKLPSSVEEQCTTLVETYGDAVLYLLVQEIDPATVCTSIKLCLASKNEPVYIPTKPFTCKHHFCAVFWYGSCSG